MWFDIWLLARIGLRYISQYLLPPETQLFSWVNSVCLYIPIFLKEIEWLVWKLCRDLSRGLSWWSKCIKLFSHLLLSPGELLRYLLPIFVYYYLLMILYFLRTIQLLLNNFFTDFLGITTTFTSPFHSISSSAGSHFGLILCMLFYSWKISYLMKFCSYIFCISVRFIVLRTTLQHVSLSFMQYLESILIIFLNVMRNLKHSLDILNKCLFITVVVTKLKNVLDLSLLWKFFGVFGQFCSMILV